ncbi:MAG TPA: family 1 encapsulin nanocompartment shell protein [Acidimicrobiales bacterium]|nr:family 1 encapsulin nanocompartment shell protein [Acidimicrobiales bacterium]
MNHLLRSHAPITEAGWEQLDEEGRQRLVPALAARKLVDFSGPLGWQYSATNLGRTAMIEGPGEGLVARRRTVLPLVELRAEFSVSRDELVDADRGAVDTDLEPLDEAARRIARAENIAVFHGWGEAGLTGIAEASPHPPLSLGTDFANYPGHVARAVERLLEGGISGPYGLALGPEGYTGVVETTEHGGLIVFDHLHRILDGPIVWAPGVKGAVVVSLRGGDFLFESGQDLSIGYSHHDAELVHLYLEESFSFRIASADAAVALNP